MKYRYVHNISNDPETFNRAVSSAEIAEKHFFDSLLKSNAITKTTEFFEITLSTFAVSIEVINKVYKELEFLRSKASEGDKEIINNIIDMLYEN